MSDDYMTEFYERLEREKKERKDKLILNAPDIIKWCDEKAAQGELAITWDGGNDSGCFYLKLDGDELENDWENKGSFETQLLNWAAEEIDYGSFAGDFYTDGYLVYDPATKCFTGTDSYSETDYDTIEDAAIRIEVPKNLWFDEVHLDVDGDDDDIHTVEASLIIKNGPLTVAHEQWGKDQEEKLIKVFNKTLDRVEVTVDSVSQNYTIPFADFQEEGDHMVHVITEIEYAYRNEEDRDTTLNLLDLINENENEGTTEQIQTLPATDTEVLSGTPE